MDKPRDAPDPPNEGRPQEAVWGWDKIAKRFLTKKEIAKAERLKERARRLAEGTD